MSAINLQGLLYSVQLMCIVVIFTSPLERWYTLSHPLCMNSTSSAFRIEEGDAVVAVVTQHKRSYEELQRALRNANLEVR